MREIDRMSGSTIYLFTTLIGPLISFVILLLIFSEGVPSHIPIGIVDMDNTSLSRKMSLWIDATPEAEIQVHTQNLQEAQEEMDKGHIQAIVLIPNGLEKEILKGNSESVQVYINNTNILSGGYLQKGIYKALATLSGGIKMQLLQKKGLSAKQAAARVQPIKMQQHVLFNPFGNYSYFLLSALLPLMVVVFTLLSNVFAVGIELREGTSHNWLKEANGSVIIAVTGKLLPYTILFSIILTVMNVIMFVQMGTPLQGSFFMIILGELTMLVTYQLIGVLLMALTANLRLSLSLASAYSMMALTFAGLTFPQMAMPGVAKFFSFLFPFTYWVRIFISQSFRGEPLVQAFVLLGAFIVFILLAVTSFPRLKRILKDEKYWGKI